MTNTDDSAPYVSPPMSPKARAIRATVLANLRVNLERLRARVGISVAELAERSDTPERLIRRAEAATLRAAELTIAHLARLAEALGVDATDLVRATATPPAPGDS